MDKRKKKKIIGITTVAMGATFVGLTYFAKKKQPDSIFENDPNQKNPLEGKRVIFVEDEKDKENADGVKGHLVEIGDSLYRPSFYEKYIKRGMDVLLSFGGLVVLSPVMGTIALAIKLEDPGPVLFTQKRLGQNKQYFKLHKFRSMKMSTPHDVPTHMLDNPDQYITKVGKFIRAHSLDELPQIWDIFIGNMSVIGPRPGLWNQDLLTAERDKYSANDVRPGLTGWAQINGRDELEIPDKAKLDGEYVKHLGPKMDTKIFLDSLHVFSNDESVVEGGTGEMKKTSVGRHYTDEKSKEDLIGPIGFGQPVEVDTTQHKKILITGKGSYIGETFKEYANHHYPDNFEIDTLDMLDPTWKETDFSDYDVVYHVAGIAHADVGNVSDETKEKYYKVNTDLAIEVCQKAKLDHVKEFIFMSSMIVYGDSAPYGQEKIIDKDTVPNPANFYGDSKLQADVAVRELADDDFKVLVLRPPMIYGKGSKGNYPTLAKLAKKLPIFPDVENQRSMLYIENLCEFLCQVMLVKTINRNSIVLFPQNKEYTKTADMVKEIANASNHSIFESKLFNPAVVLGNKVPGKVSGLVNKAFGNNCYDKSLSQYEGIEYQKNGLRNSLEKTEGNVNDTEIKKVLIVASVASMIDQFNKSNIEILQSLGYEVDVATNYFDPGTITSERCISLIKYLKDHNVDCYQIDFDRNVMDVGAINKAYKELDDVFKGKAKPIFDIDKNTHEFLYTTKKHCESKYTFIHCHSPIGGVIGRLVAYKNNVKTIYTAHGFHFYDGAPLKNWLIYYPIEKELSRLTNVLITINNEDYQRAKEKFYAKKVCKIPGVGVDTDKFSRCQVDKDVKRSELEIPKDAFVIISVGELNENKNHSVIIKALRKLNDKNVYYIIVGQGSKENELKDLALSLGLANNVKILGYRSDVPELLKISDVFAFPSKREGLGLAAIEAMASGLPLITSNVGGINDYSIDGITGYKTDPLDVSGFANGIKKLKDNKQKVLSIRSINIDKSKNYDLYITKDIMKHIYQTI